MLEIDDKDYTFAENYFSEKYYYGFQFGYVSVRLHYFRRFCKNLTLEQIRTNNIEDYLAKTYCMDMPLELVENYYMFATRYESLSDDNLAKRYISESEILPWR